MSEDRIEALFLERARLRSLGAPSQMYRATSTGFNPITFEPGPESNPILGGNEMQGFPQPTADDAMQERAPSNEVGGRLSDLATNALQLLGDDFGAAYQQFRIREVEDRIEDGSLKPVDYQMAVIENPTVPLGDYYDAASGTFSGVPSDDYILHQGQLYPRVITDAQTGEEIDLSEDNQLINFGRALMGGMMEQLEGVGVAARATQQLLRGGAPDPTVMNMGLGGATVPVDRAADVSDIGFYSAVNRAVEALPMEKGSASQMRAMIAKGEGVKPEEMAWIGLDDFLRGKKSVTKAEVQEYVQANQVQLEEVAYPTRGTVDEFENSIKDLVAKYEANGGTYVSVDIDDLENPESIRFGNKFGNEGDLDDVLEGITPEGRDAAEDILDAFDDFQRELEVTGDRTKFSEYTLPGGENYREVLLTLPKNRGVNVERYEELKRKDIAGKLNDPDEVAEFNQLMDSASNIYRGGHFDEPNVLAHMRLNDRTGPNGERILFIEEIQSDWHQKGRKAGYKTPEDTAAIAQINGRLDKLLDQEMEINGDLFDNYGLGGTALPDGNGVNFYSRDIIENNDYKVIGRVFTNGSFYVDEAFGAANPAIADRIKELSEIGAERAQLKQQRSEITRPSRELARVPDAPMKKTWHEMSFRRVARMAAEEGYDAIAWTPGKMQAERYDLSKQISEIHYSGTNFKAYGMDGEEVIGRTGVQPDDLPELIGKEAADRLMSQTAKNGLRSLTGEQLEVGGEGMKGFYDKMLKNYAAKWGKKFGAKVGVSGINTETEFAESIVPRVSDENMVDVAKALAEKRGKVWENLSGEDRLSIIDDALLLSDEELNLLNIPKPATKLEGGEKVWTLPVTKKMRDSLMKKGVPLFTAGGAVAMSQVEREQNDN
tara:strand:+ start:579 stop:3236 length:2658 start_codon:yes stop_codon:yes gene_type:complete